MSKTLLRLQQKSHIFLQHIAEYGRGQLICEFLKKMSHAGHIRTLFSLVAKNISCKWKCCISTNADEGESVDGKKIHSCPLFRRIWFSRKEDP